MKRSNQIQSPEFFEVFIPDLNSHRLCIPADFIKHFEGTIPKKTILKNLRGRVWHVDLKQEQKVLFFADGWQRFVIDNSLELGDFIVFRYNRNSDFSVRVFGNDGCKKEEASDIENRIFTVVKEEDESEPEPAPTCKRKFSQNYPAKPKNVTGYEEVSPSKPRITSITIDQDRHVGTNTDQDVPSEDLCFTTSISPHCRSRLHISKRLLSKYNIDLKSEVVLRNQSGKIWPVKVLTTSDDRRVLSSGWIEFCNDNRVGLQDKLEFQYVLTNGRECKEFMMEEHSPGVLAVKIKRSGMLDPSSKYPIVTQIIDQHIMARALLTSAT